MSFTVDGIPLTDAELLAHVSDRPCTVCQERPPTDVGICRPSDEATAAWWWEKYGPGPDVPRALGKRPVLVFGVCRSCLEDREAGEPTWTKR